MEKEKKYKVVLVTATKNRHRQLERVVKFSLNQTSNDWVHLIYNNAEDRLILSETLPKDKFILVNKSISTKTGKSYQTLGEIYTDILEFIPEDCDVINCIDDDDVFFPNHVEEGIKGMQKCGLKAYKPSKSWFKYGKNPIELVSNTLEPSIFVKKSHILEYGFSDETTAQHLKWVNPLVYGNEICADDLGVATFICDWSQQIPTFKTSGDPNNPNNFLNYEAWSQDKGDGVITPCSQEQAQEYYNIIK